MVQGHLSETDRTERLCVFTGGHIRMPFPFPPQRWNHIFRFKRGLGIERFHAHVFLPQSFPNLISMFPARFYHQSAAKTEYAFAVSHAAFVEITSFYKSQRFLMIPLLPTSLPPTPPPYPQSTVTPRHSGTKMLASDLLCSVYISV